MPIREDLEMATCQHCGRQLRAASSIERRAGRACSCPAGRKGRRCYHRLATVLAA